METELLYESFAAEYTQSNTRAAAAGAAADGGVQRVPQLVASAFGYGSLTCLINDVAGPSGADAHATCAPRAPLRAHAHTCLPRCS
jgi:hypothetical protein